MNKFSILRKLIKINLFLSKISNMLIVITMILLFVVLVKEFLIS